MISGNPRRRLLLAGLAVAVLPSVGCYAKKSYVETEFAKVRTEMQQGDQAIDQRQTAALAETNSRVGTLSTRMDAVESDLQKIRTELSDLNVKVTRLNGLIAFDVPVHFDFNKADLRDADQAVLKQFAAVVQEFYPTALLTAEGYTDPAGSTSYNLRLGQKRAEAVRMHLVNQGGLRTDRVRTVSYGEATNRLIDRKAKGPGTAGMENRRVVIVLDYVGTAVGIAPPVITN
jgi:peptidoglycan-associated lipoprotein